MAEHSGAADAAGRRSQGVKPAEPLTVERIVTAALDLIDRTGPTRFSVRALASDLGVFPASIYWHVQDRRTLLGLVAAAWIGDAVPDPAGKHWAQWLRDLGHSYRAVALAHPNVARVIAAELMDDLATLALPEALLSQLASSGIPEDELVHAYNCTVGAVVGFVELELARDAGRTHAEREAAKAAVLGVDPQQYPTLAGRIDELAGRAFAMRWTPGGESPLDESFAYLVELLATGLERRVEAARGDRV